VQFTPSAPATLTTEGEALVSQPPDAREQGYAFALAQIGVEMVAPLGVGLALDYYFGWGPWATVIGCVVGFVGGMAHLILLVRQHDAEERRPPPGRAP
jgi:F0F1-type ATP synthase assembly protein I